MDRRAGAALRWARAALLGAVAFGGGLVAHVSAQGLLPGVVALVVLYAVTTLGAAALVGRPASTTRVVLLLLAGQTFVHLVLTAASGHRGDPPLRRVAAPPAPVLPHPAAGGRRGSYFDLAYGQAHPGATDARLVVPAPVQHLLADLTGPHAVMALAHLAAAAVVGLWLAAGERALWTLVAVLVDAARSLAPSYAAALGVVARLARGVRLPAPVVRVAPPPRTDVLARVVVRRGPPRALLPAAC